MLNARLTAPSVEPGEVDRIAELAIAEIARMQAVAAIVDAEHLRRPLGVADRQVEIGDRIAGAALADPLIHRDAVSLACGVPRIRHKRFVAERRQRRADDLDAG